MGETLGIFMKTDKCTKIKTGADHALNRTLFTVQTFHKDSPTHSISRSKSSAKLVLRILSARCKCDVRFHMFDCLTTVGRYLSHYQPDGGHFLDVKPHDVNVTAPEDTPWT